MEYESDGYELRQIPERRYLRMGASLVLCGERCALRGAMLGWGRPQFMHDGSACRVLQMTARDHVCDVWRRFRAEPFDHGVSRRFAALYEAREELEVHALVFALGIEQIAS